MGLIADIKKFAIHDGPGIRTTVFLKGCPLNCWWCHNPEMRSAERELLFRSARCLRCGRCVEACDRGAMTMSPDGPRLDESRCEVHGGCAEACPAEAREIIGREMTVQDVMVELRRDRVFFEQSGGGATFSGGEPLMQSAFLLELLRACREERIHRVVDTTGYATPADLAAIAEVTDLFLYDLKLMDEARHRRYCGTPLKPILENLSWLSARRRPVRLRVPLIPGVTDEAANLDLIGRFIASLPSRHPLDILPYQRMGVGKYDLLNEPYQLPDVRPPTNGQIDAAVTILKGHGLEVFVRGEPR